MYSSSMRTYEFSCTLSKHILTTKSYSSWSFYSFFFRDSFNFIILAFNPLYLVVRLNSLSPMFSEYFLYEILCCRMIPSLWLLNLNALYFFMKSRSSWEPTCYTISLTPLIFMIFLFLMQTLKIDTIGIIWSLRVAWGRSKKQISINFVCSM